MYPRIQAEESLRRMSDVAAATGSMEEASQRDYRREQVRQANGGRQPKGQKASVESLAAMGIKVVTRD